MRSRIGNRRIGTGSSGPGNPGPCSAGRSGESQRGEGRIGCIFWLLVLVLGVIVAWEIVPIKMRSVELYEYMEDEAGLATHGRSVETIKKRILTKAQDLNIPLDKDHLHVEKHGDNIRMRASYTIPAKFPFYTYYWEFEHELDRPLYIF